MLRIVITLTLLIVFVGNGVSQTLSAETRAQELAASFNKFKSLTKSKYGVTRAKYKDVHCEPLVRPNVREYSGVYEVADLGYVIDIRVGSDGMVNAAGNEKGQQVLSFKLENAKIEGGLLTATKVYQNGSREKFEGVFVKRTDRTSPTDPGVTTIGLGVLLSVPIEAGGLTYEKLFYQLR